MEGFFGFLKIAVMCLTALAALFMVLLALPRSPFRDLVLSLTKRVGATAGAVMMVPPVDMIPVAGEVYDLGALAFLAWYWYTFFRDLRGTSTPPAPPPLPLQRR